MGGMRDDSADSSSLVVFRDMRSEHSDHGPDHGPDHGLEPQPRAPLKTDWRDFVAITLAVYQILLGPLLLIMAGIVGVYLLFLWLAR
jgi:hypothetical protein